MKKPAFLKNKALSGLSILAIAIVLMVLSLAIPFPRKTLKVQKTVGEISNECRPQYYPGDEIFCCVKGSIVNEGNFAAYRVRTRANFYDADGTLMESLIGSAGHYNIEKGQGRSVALPLRLRSATHPDIVQAGCNSDVEVVVFSAEYKFQYYIKKFFDTITKAIFGRTIFG